MPTDPSAAGHVPEVAALIDRDHSAIVAAMHLVASGGSPRVTLANLRFGEPLLTELAPQAAALGLRLRPIWPNDADSPIDIVVERDVDE